MLTPALLGKFIVITKVPYQNTSIENLLKAWSKVLQLFHITLPIYTDLCTHTHTHTYYTCKCISYFIYNMNIHIVSIPVSSLAEINAQTWFHHVVPHILLFCTTGRAWSVILVTAFTSHLEPLKGASIIVYIYIYGKLITLFCLSFLTILN